MVVQSSRTKLALLRPVLQSMDSRAASSLPVPVSPVIRAGVSVRRADPTIWRRAPIHRRGFCDAVFPHQRRTDKLITTSQRPSRDATSPAERPE